MIARVRSAWNHFWFEAESQAQTRLFRMAFGILMGVFYSIRFLDLEFFYTSDGLVSSLAYQDVLTTDYRYSLLDYLPSAPWVLYTVHSVFIVSLLTLALGVFPRASAILAFALHLSFLHRNMSIVYGADLISTFFLMYLCLADHRYGRVSGGEGASDKSDFTAMLGSVALRLSQIQVCIIYFYSGLEKLKGQQWWKGEAIWEVLANSQLARFDFSFMAHFPLLIVAATYLTLLWEIYFPVLVWLKRFRIPMLALGVALHLGIAFAVNIPFFGVLMILTYAYFLRTEEAVWLERTLLKPFRGRLLRGSTSASKVSGTA